MAREPIAAPRLFNGPVLPFRRKSDSPGYSMAAKNDTGEVWLYDVIGDSWDGTTAKRFAADLKVLGDVKTLNIYVNSPGGSVFDGVAIYNQLDRHKARKVVQIDGLAASIASVIAMVGDEIVIAANGMMMIHDPWSIAIGTAAEFRKVADSLDKVRDSIVGTYEKRTGQPADRLSDLMTAETWFTADEAVELGLADRKGDDVEMAAFAGMDLSAFRHPPAALKDAADVPPPDAAPDDAAAPASRRMHHKLAAARATLIKRGLRRPA